MHSEGDIIASLQYRVKAQEHRLKSFENGSVYKKMELGRRRLQDYYERRLREKDRQIREARQAVVTNRNNWFQVFQDIQEEFRRITEKKDQEIAARDREIAALKEKLRENTREVTEERSRAIDEQEKNRKLQGQIKENFRNSSIPSSKTQFRGKVPNNREKTDRKPGGQTGHEGHGRKKHEVNGESVFVEAPAEIRSNPDYYEQTGRNAEIHKQQICLRVSVIVNDYWAKIYRNRKTGARYHAPFPGNIQDEVNYDESVRAFIFLMKNRLNVGEAKISEFLSELTDGELKPSAGMINGINAEFSARTQEEQEAAFRKLAAADVLYTDMTNCRMNGKQKNVVICTDKETVMYFYREKKGDAAFKGTPVENFVNTLVHDHDRTMYHYGSEHQECNEHHLRYLVGAQEMEPKLTWHKKMHDLLQEMNHAREQAEGRVLTDSQIEDFEKRYDEYVRLAEQEYYDNPPSPYYRKGYNLSKEFRQYRESILYFLRHPETDFTNNVSERCARKVGRHMAVSGTFRGNTDDAPEDYCAALGILEGIRMQGGNTYENTKEVFRREKPNSKRGNPKLREAENTTSAG